MSEARNNAIMGFRALHVPTLTAEIAKNLEAVLNNLSGVEQFAITLETQELYIIFDRNRLAFPTLVQEMARAGCFLRDINAALLF